MVKLFVEGGGDNDALKTERGIVALLYRRELRSPGEESV
jgi:hypothetical protein